MSKKKFILVGAIIAAALIFVGCSKDNNGDGSVLSAEDNSSIIFFYGKECPHCQKVEEYFNENKTAEKVQFSQREVYHDKANAALLVQKAKDCGISEKELGVPLLWVEGKCYTGDQDIISYFNGLQK